MGARCATRVEDTIRSRRLDSGRVSAARAGSSVGTSVRLKSGRSAVRPRPCPRASRALTGEPVGAFGTGPEGLGSTFRRLAPRVSPPRSAHDAHEEEQMTEQSRGLSEQELEAEGVNAL